MKTCLMAAVMLVPAILPGAVRIGVDPRVELLSIVFRLSGAPEYTQGSVSAYNAAIDRYFEKFREHEAVRLARALRESEGIAYDAPMNLALHLSDVSKLEERMPFDSAGIRLDKRWGGAKARPFVAAVRRFARDTDFASFLKSNETLYRETDARLRAMAEEQGDLGWFGKFFGVKAEGNFSIIPGLVNGGASYGVLFTGPGGEEEASAIPGVWEVDSTGLPLFRPNNFPTLVHEFLHSFVNPLVSRHLKELAPAGDVLYQHTSDDMNAQAYTTGQIVLCESLVRAATIRYVAEHNGAEAARNAIQGERGRSFVWTPQIVAALDRYADSRDTYPNMETFVPELVKAFRAAADGIEPMLKSYDEERPRVISLSVPNGATDVDPAVRELVIRFDRKMRDRVAIGGLRGSVQPKFGRGVFDAARTSVTVPMTLEPGKEYKFTLNWRGGGSFASETGALLRPLEVTFRTASQ